MLRRRRLRVGFGRGNRRRLWTWQYIRHDHWQHRVDDDHRCDCPTAIDFEFRHCGKDRSRRFDHVRQWHRLRHDQHFRFDDEHNGQHGYFGNYRCFAVGFASSLAIRDSNLCKSTDAYLER